MAERETTQRKGLNNSVFMDLRGTSATDEVVAEIGDERARFFGGVYR